MAEESKFHISRGSVIVLSWSVHGILNSELRHPAKVRKDLGSRCMIAALVHSYSLESLGYIFFEEK